MKTPDLVCDACRCRRCARVHRGPALGDIAEAGRVTGPIAFTAPAAAEGEDEAADVTVAESELGEPPAKKPKK